VPKAQDHFGVCKLFVRLKLAPLEAVPPAVVIVIFPANAPGGTVAVTSVSEFTVNCVAATPSNVTPLV
jgi:hypothetical protein